MWIWRLFEGSNKSVMKRVHQSVCAHCFSKQLIRPTNHPSDGRKANFLGPCPVALAFVGFLLRCMLHQTHAHSPIERFKVQTLVVASVAQRKPLFRWSNMQEENSLQESLTSFQVHQESPFQSAWLYTCRCPPVRWVTGLKLTAFTDRQGEERLVGPSPERQPGLG